MGSFPNATSRRRLLGVGQGVWSDWKSLGTLATRPGVDSRSGHAYAASTALTGVVSVFDCTTTGTIGCTGQNLSNSAQSRSDVAVGGTNLHAVSWRWPNGEAQFMGTSTAGGAWTPTSGWFVLSGIFAASPVGAGRTTGQLDVVGRGTDNAAYFRTWNTDGTWTPSLSQSWRNLGGTLTHAPAIATRATGETDVVARGTGGTILYKYRAASGTWHPGTTAWTNLGTTVLPPALGERPNGDSGHCRAEFSQRRLHRHTLQQRYFQWLVLSGSNPVGHFGNLGRNTFREHLVRRPSRRVARASDGSIMYKFFNEQTEQWWPSLDLRDFPQRVA